MVNKSIFFWVSYPVCPCVDRSVQGDRDVVVQKTMCSALRRWTFVSHLGLGNYLKVPLPWQLCPKSRSIKGLLDVNVICFSHLCSLLCLNKQMLLQSFVLHCWMPSCCIAPGPCHLGNTVFGLHIHWGGCFWKSSCQNIVAGHFSTLLKSACVVSFTWGLFSAVHLLYGTRNICIDLWNWENRCCSVMFPQGYLIAQQQTGAC